MRSFSRRMRRGRLPVSAEAGGGFRGAWFVASGMMVLRGKSLMMLLYREEEFLVTEAGWNVHRPGRKHSGAGWVRESICDSARRGGLWGPGYIRTPLFRHPRGGGIRRLRSRCNGQKHPAHSNRGEIRIPFLHR